MMWYCEKCRRMHDDHEMCPHIVQQVKKDPSIISDAANFAVVAGEYHLSTSNALNSLFENINKVAGTNLSYEGTHQISRDIQVFKRLNEEPFVRAGVFSTPQKAQAYLANVKKIAETKPKSMTAFDAKLTGYAQEIDWLREMKGRIDSIIYKSELLSGNAAGVDGTTYNRFTGKTISRTTIKASINPMDKNSKGILDVKEAIKKGTASKKDIIFGPEGTEAAARAAGLDNPVIEKNSYQEIKLSNERLKSKIEAGKAHTTITPDQLGASMLNGAVIGAAIELTMSSITCFIKYRNGEISRDEAFREIGEETAKGAITGGALSGITLFLPASAVGFVGGMAVGIYVSAVTKNLLDEVFGKGFYEQVLHTSGYIYGTSTALADAVQIINANQKQISRNLHEVRTQNETTSANIDALIAKLGG